MCLLKQGKKTYALLCAKRCLSIIYLPALSVSPCMSGYLFQSLPLPLSLSILYHNKPPDKPPLPKSTHQRVHHNSKMAVIRSRAAFAERCPRPKSYRPQFRRHRSSHVQRSTADIPALDFMLGPATHWSHTTPACRHRSSPHTEQRTMATDGAGYLCLRRASLSIDTHFNFLPRIYSFLINLLTFNCLFTALMVFF